MEKKHEYYDVVIIGGGASGLTSAIYCSRARLKTLLIEKSLIGGLATYTNEIANYPGFPEGITGTELMNLFHKQAKNFGVNFKLTDVKGVQLEGKDKLVETFRVIYHAKSVIISTGGKPRLTRAENEESFLYDRGISFCATCDAAYYTNKTVMVIGSGDAAIEEGIFLTKFAKKVIVSVIHDKGIMDANKIAQEQALKNPKMEFKWNTVVDSFEGDERLNTVVLKNVKSGELEPIEVDGCFLFIGYVPNTEIFRGQINLTPEGYIMANEKMETNIEGVFAVGDVRDKLLKQVATAVGDGAIAGVGAEKYIAESEVFENEIMQKEKIGLIYLWSPLDEICRNYLIVIEELEKEMNQTVKVQKIDVYKNSTLAARLGTTKAPTLVYTKNGKVVKIDRNISREHILELIKAIK
ncbi:pyridine nucleotide-disulfide oxidoreductase [Clostridium polyendosporum]|uniref:Pyridine nucleotide-disulfide oxidoreductase n=1 Tax=Clostridium polyendosporum TaxID=69208 RepID=A0A919S028_9CLOT|nr:FAD-dependent oxidoreductase [Clostridium polyendosporum]GIM29362.1 pyridine nucleotide-disulfide oxidoreductase [Clostridium polyendosporum]